MPQKSGPRHCPPPVAGKTLPTRILRRGAERRGGCPRIDGNYDQSLSIITSAQVACLVNFARLRAAPLPRVEFQRYEQRPACPAKAPARAAILNGYSGDAKTGKDGNLHDVENRAEGDRRGKLTSDYGDWQRGHGDAQGRQR